MHVFRSFENPCVKVVLLAAVLWLDLEDLLSYQAAVASEALSQLNLVRKGHNCNFIFRFEASDSFDCCGANLIIEGVDATGPIDEQQYRNGSITAAEVRDGLLYAIFEQQNVVLFEIAEDAAGLRMNG